MSDTSPLVYIIIVTWNSREQLEYCLPSVDKTDYPNYKVLVIDNNSEDYTVNFLRKNFPDVELIQNTKNRGYAGGNNDGIKYALVQGAKYICIINPDIKVDPRWITQAVKAIETSPRHGIVGFKVFGEQRDEPDKDIQFEQAKKEWCELKIERIPDDITLSGNALFCRSYMFEGVGLFDEGYFCYGEESDLEIRLRRAGYDIVRINIPLWHEGEGSFKKVRLKSSYLSIRNTIRCDLKNNRSFLSIFRNFKRLIILVGRKTPDVDMTYRYYQRLRFSKPWNNIILLLVASLWNLIYLPQTIIARLQAHKRVKIARAMLDRLK